MAECERLYDKVVRKAFSVRASQAQSSKAAQDEDEDEDDAGGAGGRSWWQMLCSRGSSMKRFVLTGAKYDAQPLVTALHAELCGKGLACEDAMIDAALDPARPATAIVATLSSERPLKPYVFRSYQVTSETKVSLCAARTKGLGSERRRLRPAASSPSPPRYVDRKRAATSPKSPS